MKHQLCPKCDGQGIVSKPPYLPAEIMEWSSTQTQWTCGVCNGNKTLLIPDESPDSEAVELLKEYEQLEAALISDNAMWWPYVEKDRISGQTYDKMMELQAKRNRILYPDKYT